MRAHSSPDIQAILDALDAAEHEARALLDGLDERAGTWRPAPGAWSISECLDHLATANRVYLAAFAPAARAARDKGRMRRGAALPGLVGRLFIATLEPPVRLKTRAPSTIRPRTAPPLGDSWKAFLASQDEVRAFVRAQADLDLAHVAFPNPFIRGVRFSLATGLHVIAAHERRHLWQARKVRATLPAAA
jgi:hypothetical protein